MSKRKLIASTVLLFAVFGLFLLSYPFLRSLSPSSKAIAESTFVIDLGGIEPGSFSKLATSIGEIWVVNRTTQQIDYLLRNPGVELVTNFRKPENQFLPQGANEDLRSSSPEWFVFVAWGNAKEGYLVLEGFGSGVRCQSLEAFSTETVFNDHALFGGVECKGAFMKPGGSNIAFNLAGRATSEYVWPLRIPNYEIKHGKIYVYPGT